jgi:hypothetical protein
MYCARLVPAIVLIRYVYIYSQRLEVQIAVAYITFIMSDKVKINVGGQLFLTKRNTLQRLTGKKKSNITETCDYFDKISVCHNINLNWKL